MPSVLHIASQIISTISKTISAFKTISMTTWQRRFHKLKLILSDLQASVGPARFCDISADTEETESTDFVDMADKCLNRKRKEITVLELTSTFPSSLIPFVFTQYQCDILLKYIFL